MWMSHEIVIVPQPPDSKKMERLHFYHKKDGMFTNLTFLWMILVPQKRNDDVPLRKLRQSNGSLPRLACAALHLVGGLLGFVATKSSGFDERTCRTVAIDARAASGAGHPFFFLLVQFIVPSGKLTVCY